MPPGSPGCLRCSPCPFAGGGSRAVVGLLILIILTALSGAQAQDVRLGVRAGPTFGFLNDSAVPFVSAGDEVTANTNIRLDLHAGAFAVLPVRNRFALQTEVLFVQKGGHFSRTTALRYASERYRLSYVQGQLLGRRGVSLPGTLSLHVVGGLTVSRATGGAVRRDVRSREFVFEERIPLLKTGLIRRWDVGLLIGVGLDYPVGKGQRVSLDLRYNPGLRSVFSTAEHSGGPHLVDLDDPPPLTRTPPTLRHDVLTAGLSYTLPLRW